MKGFHFSLTSRTYAGFAVVSLTCAFTLQPLAQAPRSFLALGSYAQQPPIRAMDETPHFEINPEVQGDILMRASAMLPRSMLTG